MAKSLLQSKQLMIMIRLLMTRIRCKRLVVSTLSWLMIMNMQIMQLKQLAVRKKSRKIRKYQNLKLPRDPSS
jgi:hypothetical protein